LGCEGGGAVSPDGFFEDGGGEAAFLFEEGREEVRRLEFRVAEPGGDGLRGLDGLGGFVGEAFSVHARMGLGRGGFALKLCSFGAASLNSL
jgi:hypothetical protein